MENKQGLDSLLALISPPICTCFISSSPDPTICAHSNDPKNQDPDDCNAVEFLLGKFVYDPTITDK